MLRQLLTESIVLAALGGLASLVVAYGTLRAIASILPPQSASEFTLSLSPTVVLFSGALAIGTGVLFGLYPALHSTRPDLGMNPDNVVTFAISPVLNGYVGSITFYVRTQIEPSQTVAAIGGVVRRLDPSLPVESLKTLEQQVKENVVLERLISTLSAAFAVLATILAAVGLYGVLAYTGAYRLEPLVIPPMPRTSCALCQNS